jgi:chain length determinant protein tyrosine kinase EpsG
MRMLSSHFPTRSSKAGGAQAENAHGTEIVDRRIGELMRHRCKLTDKQIEWVLNHHREHDLRFGEAAVELGLARREDVLWALSEQFHYPYAVERSQVSAELVVAAAPFGAEAEIFRDLRSQLLNGVLSRDEPRRALAVVSVDVGDGKTYTASNIAASLSQLGGPTLFLDADMRTPRSHDLFGIPLSRTGLSSMLNGRADDGLLQRSAVLPSLYLLPVGALPPNPVELIQRPLFHKLVQEMVAKFDHVVVDTPAHSRGGDWRDIAAICGAAVIVARRGRTRMSAIGEMVASLHRVRVAVAGVVMNEH